MAQISKISSLSYATISNNLSKLDKNGYVIKEGGQYIITNVGRIRLSNFLELNQTLNTIENSKDILYNHNIGMFSKEDMLNFNNLIDSKIETTDNENVYKLDEIKENILRDAEFLNFIMPYVHPLYIELINDLFESKVPIHLVLYQKAFNILSDDLGRNLIKEKLRSGQLKVTTRKDINFELIVTDKSMSLSLFRNEGVLDQNRLLLSNSINAVDWGLNVFNNFIENKNIKGYYNLPILV